MPRLRNSRTGVVVNIGDDVAARLSGEWKPVERLDKGGTLADPVVAVNDSDEPEKVASPSKSRPARRRSSKN
ncbi:MAG: hypothetical protein ACTH0C_10990 [Actinomycetaceae bacterium]